MTKINGYEDCHMVNQPARTREELVEIMIQAIHPNVGKIYRRFMQVEQGQALDALIAIGAVRVK